MKTLLLLSLAWQATPVVGPRTSEVSGTTGDAFLRPAVALAPEVGPSFGLGSGGDLSVAFFGTPKLPHEAYVRVSDGRGLEWGPPIRLNVDRSRMSEVAVEGVQVVEDRSYLLWREYLDDTVSSPYFGVSADRGTRWSVLPLASGRDPGLTPVNRLQLAVAPRADHDLLFVLLSSSGSGSTRGQELSLVRSVDGGMTFNEARPVSSTAGNGTEIESFDLATDGDALHVAWTEDRAGQGNASVFHRVSHDGGASWGSVETQLTADASVDNRDVQVSFEGARVVLLWRELADAGGSAKLVAAVSSDSGLGFSAPKEVGNAGPNAFVGGLALQSDGGAFLALWHRNDPSSSADSVTLAARSLDGGATWLQEVSIPSQSGPPGPLSIAGEGQDWGVVCWTSKPSTSSAFTRDFGTSWRPGAPEHASGAHVAQSRPIAFNRRYRNFLRLYTRGTSSSEELLLDGYRPQTLEPLGFQPAAEEISFRFTGFTGEFPLVFVLLSEAPGGFRLPGETARFLGLGLTPLLLNTIHGGDELDAVLDPTGRGMSVPRAPLALLPPLYAVAVAYDPNHFTFGAITDVIQLTLP